MSKYSHWNEEAEIVRRMENPEIDGRDYPPDPDDPMDYRFSPTDTCPECHEPTEVELREVDGSQFCDACADDKMEAELKQASTRRTGETISTVVSRANAILTKYGISLSDTRFEWCSKCQKPTETYLDGFTGDWHCAICG